MSIIRSVTQLAGSVAQAWYVRLTDGVNTLGTLANPVRVDTTATTTQPVSGSLSITGTPSVQITDEYGFDAELTPMNEVRTASKVRLCGATFVGTTVDSNFWTATTANGGTVTQASGQVVLATSANIAGSTAIETVRHGRYVGGTSNLYRAIVQLGDTGTASNIRRWGAVDTTSPGPTPQDGAYWKLDGTTLSVCTMKAGAEVPVASAAWNASTTVPTLTNANTYEIYLTNGKVYFSINGVLKHTVDASSATWTSTIELHAFASNVNTGNGSNITLSMRVATISRLGNLESETTSSRITTAGTYVLKRSAGKLHTVVINDPAAAGSTLTIYDNTAASGTIIGIPKAASNQTPVGLPYKCPFSIGLTIVSTGTWDVTVVYE